MHTYRRMPQGNGDYLYTVGFESPSTELFRPIADFAKESEARALTSFLNGGENPRKPWPPEVV